MVWRLIFADDYDTYADQAAFEAAYPDQYGIDPTSVHRVAWGLTNGPGGIPGVMPSEVSSNNFAKKVSPSGAAFKVSGLFDNSDHDDGSVRAASLEVEAVSGDPDFDTFPILFVANGRYAYPAHASSVNDLYIVWDDVVTSRGDYVANAFPYDTISTVELEGKVSSGSDGYFVIRINGVEVYRYDGQLGEEPDRGWNDVYIVPGGKFSALRIYDQASLPTLPPPGSQIDNSVPCCCQQCQKKRKLGIGISGHMPEPVDPTLWFRSGAQDGAVPTAPDPDDEHDPDLIDV